MGQKHSKVDWKIRTLFFYGTLNVLLGVLTNFDSVTPYFGGFRSYKNNFNDFWIAVMVLLTKLFRMALRGNLVWAKKSKKQFPCPLVFKNCLSTLISSASKAKNICSYFLPGMRSRSRSRSRRNGLLGAGAGAVKNGAAPAPKRDTIVEKITECWQRNNKQPNKQIAYIFHQ